MPEWTTMAIKRTRRTMNEPIINSVNPTTHKCISRAFLLSFAYYILLLPLMLFFYFGSDSGSGACYQIYMLGGLFGYTFLYLALPILILLFTPLCRKSACGLFLASGIAAFLTYTVLIIDVVILAKFGYHINGLVINLLFTRGGFESMGLDAATILQLFLALRSCLCSLLSWRSLLRVP